MWYNLLIMKKLNISLLVAGLAFAGCVFSAAAETTFARDALMPFVNNGQLPGAVNIFTRPGAKEVACVGYADVAKKRPVTVDSAYMQCSQTKGFCGVTIAILVEEGKISLDDPVAKFIPEFGNLWVDVTQKGAAARTLVKAKNVLTVRNVMNHTGGFPFELPNFQAMGGWSRRMPLQSVALTAAAQPLLFEPGTRVQYSNVGIDIGAAIVERVTGKRWEQFLQERVFNPLGMKSSTFWPTEAQLATHMELYGCRRGQPAFWRSCDASMQRPFGDDRVFSSAGAGLWTTAADQLKFYTMLMNLGVGENGARILKEETVKNILAKSTRPRGMGGYSLGLSAPEVDDENQWFGHGGAWGTNCMVNWHKKQLKLWAVQLTGGPRPWDGPRNQAAEKFFSAKIDTAAEKAYTGRMK